MLGNPTAGRGAALGVARQVVHTLGGLGLEAFLVLPGGPPEAAAAVRSAADELARRGRPPSALVAVGGDGTVRLAAGLAADTGLELGMIPAGTGNGTAYSLGLPLDAWEACRVVARGRAVPCDLGLLEFPGGGEAAGPFLNVAGAGLDAVIARTYGEQGRLGLHGVTGYLVAALRSLAAFRPVPLEIVLDGQALELEVLLVAVGNGAFYGKGIRIVPPADPADGYLDVCLVLPVSLADLSLLVPLLLAGRHPRHPKVRVLRGREVVLRVAGPARGAGAVPVHADGDLVGELPVRFTVRSGGVRVIVPEGVPRTGVVGASAGPPPGRT